MVRKYRDATTVFTLTIVLPDSSSKRQDHRSGKPNPCVSILGRCEWVAEQAGSKGSTGKLPWMKPEELSQKHENPGRKKNSSFCENTVIGYLYVDDSSCLPRLSHSMNCLAVHLSANSWLNLNILWLKWMHQRLKACKVTWIPLSSTSRCTSIPLMLALMYPLGLHLVCFWP